MTSYITSFNVTVSKNGVAEGADGKTSFTPDADLQPTTRFYWRARMTQAATVSAWSPVGKFRSKLVGFLRDGALFDPLIHGETLGERGKRSSRPGAGRAGTPTPAPCTLIRPPAFFFAGVLMRRLFYVLPVLVLLSACGGDSNPAGPGPTTIPPQPYTATDLVVGTGAEAVNGKVVTVDYAVWLFSLTGTDNKGTLVGTSVNSAPFTLHGRRYWAVIPGSTGGWWG